MYVNKDIQIGQEITRDDLYFAMPLQDSCLNASHIYDVIGNYATAVIKQNAPMKSKYIIDVVRESLLKDFIDKFNIILEKAGITVTDKDDVELSCHFGLEKFNEVGALIISKINRSYCKKIIAMLSNQSHPTHRHLQKEECFELLTGDCILTLNGRDINLKKGQPILINRKVNHSFRTKNGCVIEEVSTTHIKGDSVYENPAISKLSVDERKVNIKL